MRPKLAAEVQGKSCGYDIALRRQSNFVPQDFYAMFMQPKNPSFQHADKNHRRFNVRITVASGCMKSDMHLSHIIISTCLFIVINELGT